MNSFKGPVLGGPFLTGGAFLHPSRVMDRMALLIAKFGLARPQPVTNRLSHLRLWLMLTPVALISVIRKLTGQVDPFGGGQNGSIRDNKGNCRMFICEQIGLKNPGLNACGVGPGRDREGEDA